MYIHGGRGWEKGVGGGRVDREGERENEEGGLKYFVFNTNEHVTCE